MVKKSKICKLVNFSVSTVECHLIGINPRVVRNMNEFEGFTADGPFSDP